MNTKIIEKSGSVAYIKDMPKKEYTAVYKKSGGWIAASIKEVPGVHTQGRTMKEVNNNLYDALGLMLDVNGDFNYSPSLRFLKKNLSIKTKN
ncbi:MAG TPA: type II toxin-antitoxin system HicB family antitoxin [Candidatus Paceibacterota bacterium]